MSLVLLLVARGARSGTGFHLRMTSGAGPFAPGPVRDSVEGYLSHCAGLLVVKMASITLGVFAGVMALRAVHVHVSIVRKEDLAETGGIGHLSRRC